MNNISTKDPLNPKDVNISNHVKIPSPNSEPTNGKTLLQQQDLRHPPTSATLKKIIHHHMMEKYSHC